MRLGSLFSGYGGLDEAVRNVTGAQLAWVSDIDKGANKILAHRYPDIPNLGDISQIDWSAMKRAANRKLTPEQVASAVRMYDELEMSLAPIAEYFGVTRQAMWDLLRRRTTMRPQKRYGADNHFYRGGSRSDGRAHNITEKAIERGVLVRPDKCETCGGDGRAFRDGRHPIQAHHADYNQPLDVMWLCQPCHHEWHRTNTAVPVEGGDANGSLADIDVLTGGFP
jgi:predicted HTH domain antitoxin